ncbi:MAG: RNase adapter RapZ [bacterium]|nr:RNase adapter RapZ [bacterium]
MKIKQILIISGLSGAGKSTYVKALEDLDFFVVDNLPVELLERSINLLDEFKQKSTRLAFVVDARELNFLKALPKTWARIKKLDYQLQLLFFDCSDEILIQRYKETRRKHPLERGGGIRDGIKLERKILGEIKSLADEIIVTDKLNVHDLKGIAQKRFSQPNEPSTIITLLSFGFKNGVPTELDLCFDSRFIDNPFFDKNLRPLTGLDKKVSAFVFSTQIAKNFLKHLIDFLNFLVPLYQKEGKSYITVAIGCTGGQHRSVALVEALAKKIHYDNIILRTEHRDINKNKAIKTNS